MIMACRLCHLAKVKCSKTYPCFRCQRLGCPEDCVPHESRQGQRSRNRKRTRIDDQIVVDTCLSNPLPLFPQQQQQQQQGSSCKIQSLVEADQILTRNNGTVSIPQGGNVPNRSEYVSMSQTSRTSGPDLEKACVENVVISHATNFSKSHFGLHHLVRSWISYAITRRSFRLLAKASTLAVQSGLTMDRVLGCHECPIEWEGVASPMDFAPSILLTPAEHQIVAGERLHFSDVPNILWTLTHCMPPWTDDESRSLNTTNDIAMTTQKINACHHLGDRLITVKEMNCGSNRFFVSPAFEEKVCKWSAMQHAWIQNQSPVMELYLPKSESSAYGQGVVRQTLIHSNPHQFPTPTRIPITKLRLNSGQIIPVECIMCLHLVSLDLCYFYVEFITVNESASNDCIGEDKGLFDDLTTLDWNMEFEDWAKEIGLLDME
jgi:Fungal Zn(2)-Cys(6) binuclear cluster domain